MQMEGVAGQDNVCKVGHFKSMNNIDRKCHNPFMLLTHAWWVNSRTTHDINNQREPLQDTHLAQSPFSGFDYSFWPDYDPLNLELRFRTRNLQQSFLWKWESTLARSFHSTFSLSTNDRLVLNRLNRCVYGLTGCIPSLLWKWHISCTCAAQLRLLRRKILADVSFKAQDVLRNITPARPIVENILSSKILLAESSTVTSLALLWRIYMPSFANTSNQQAFKCRKIDHQFWSSGGKNCWASNSC